MLNTQNIQDGEYSEQVPAIIYEPFRHPLMVEEDRDYIKEIKQELALDQALGLKNQAFIDQQTALHKDIDELTNSRDYFEVKQAHLNKLFHMNWLKFRVVLFNIQEIFMGTIRAFDQWFYVHIIGIASVMWFATLFFPAFSRPFSGLKILGITCCCLSYLGAAVLFINLCERIGKYMSFI